MYRVMAFAASFLLLIATAVAEDAHEVKVAGEKWLRTVVTSFDGSSKKSAAATYKVYTQVYDFDGEGFITKGAGGKYTHHRGLFIGWRQTHVGDRVLDTWHMLENYQEHVKWLERKNGKDRSVESQIVEWRDLDDDAFIREERTIVATPGPDGTRIIDFTSELSSLAGTIQLKGDLQHAGMQIRLANEVSTHEDTTEYLLPEGASENEDDEVIGAWWVMCSPEIGGKRYWVMHMTPQGHPGGVPVYSIRRYGRFGAFFEPELREGEPLTLRFRIVVSKTRLDAEACVALYAAYH